MAGEMIWLKTTDGSIQQVEQEVAMLCPVIRQEVLKKKGFGSFKNDAIPLPEQVNPEMISLIFDYCRFHLTKGRSDKELKNYDDNLIRRMDKKRLCELIKAANSLQLEPLVELIGRALARIIERETKTPEEISEIFLKGLTEEEKLEPLENIMNDPTIRLLNKLNAKKREKLKSVAAVEEEEEEHVEEERSVDDLLSFINGEDDDPKVVKKKTSKSKKKKNKKKNGSTSTGGTCEEEASEKDSHDNIRSKSTSAEIVDKTESSLGDEIVDKTESSVGDEIVDDGIDDGDIDDDPKVVKKKTSKSKKKKNKKNKEKNGTSTGTCEEAEKDSHNICSKSPSAAEIVDKTESSLGDEIVDKTESSLGDEIADKTESSLGDEIVDKTESSLGDEISDKTESSSLGDVSSMEDDSSTPNTDTGDDVPIAFSLWHKQKNDQL